MTQTDARIITRCALILASSLEIQGVALFPTSPRCALPSSPRLVWDRTRSVALPLVASFRSRLLCFLLPAAASPLPPVPLLPAPPHLQPQLAMRKKVSNLKPRGIQDVHQKLHLEDFCAVNHCRHLGSSPHPAYLM